jgi:hypothetical protein
MAIEKNRHLKLIIELYVAYDNYDDVYYLNYSNPNSNNPYVQIANKIVAKLNELNQLDNQDGGSRADDALEDPTLLGIDIE